jgi:hypothetical protein
VPGTLTIDAGKTFATMLVMGISQKLKFGTDDPDISVSGEKKWTAETAVSYLAEPGMRAVSEVISVTVTGGDNLATSITPGTPVEFTDLRCGVSAPEKRENGRIAGGRLYWMASGIRPAHGANGARPVMAAAKAD